MSKVSGPTATETQRLVERIHASGTQLVLAVTGGGSPAIAELLSVPGASRSILEATVPYSAAALSEWLGAPPEQYCSEHTGRAMAMAALGRAQRFAEGVTSTADAAAPLAGVGCTASLRSDRPKRGAHRAFIAVQTRSTTCSCAIELTKDRRTRAEEEQLVARLILNAIAEACGLAERLPLPLLDGEQVVPRRYEASPEWQELWAGQRAMVCMGPWQDGSPTPTLVFPGAFNPLHTGHRHMAQLAREIEGCKVAFELAIVNVDKPPLDFQEVADRASQFAPHESLWLTRAATFIDKAGLFPGAKFVVGADTIVRIADPRYYDGDAAKTDAAIRHLAAAGCSFLVFGRKYSGEFCTLADLSLPPELRQLCQEVPAAAFREDISSTEIRQARD